MKPTLVDLPCQCGCGRILNVWVFPDGTPWRRDGGPMMEVSWENQGKRPSQPIWLHEADMQALMVVLRHGLRRRRWWMFWAR